MPVFEYIFRFAVFVNFMFMPVKVIDNVHNFYGIFIFIQIQKLALAVLETCQAYNIGILIGLKNLVIGKTIRLNGTLVIIPDIISQNIS